MKNNNFSKVFLFSMLLFSLNISTSEFNKTDKQNLEELEKVVDNKISTTVQEDMYITHPKRTQINDLIQTTIALGELRHKINPSDEVPTLSLPRKVMIKTLESLNLRPTYTAEEKSKAKTIISELEKQQKKLDLAYESLYFHKRDSNNRKYDLLKFDKALHDQKRIIGQALFPYLGNTEQPNLKIK